MNNEKRIAVTKLLIMIRMIMLITLITAMRKIIEVMIVIMTKTIMLRIILKRSLIMMVMITNDDEADDHNFDSNTISTDCNNTIQPTAT